MNDKYIDDFVEKTGMWTNVYSKMKFSLFLFILSPLSIVLYPFLVSLFSNEVSKWFCLFIVATPFILFFFLFNGKVKKILDLAPSKSFFWNSPANIALVRERDIEIAKELVFKTIRVDHDAIPLIVEKLNNKVIDGPKKFPYWLVVIVVLLYPIWNNFIIYLFDIYREPAVFGELLSSLAISLLIVGMAGGMAFVIFKFFGSLVEEVAHHRAKHIRYLVSLLEQIFLEKRLSRNLT